MSADLLPPLDPNFDVEANQQGRIIATSIALIVLTTAFVSLRLLSRRLSRAGFWWDDLLVVIALIFCLIGICLNFVQIKNGYGRHVYIYSTDVRRVKIRLWLRTLYVFETMYHTATAFAKYSVLAFYYRILLIPQFRRILLIIAGFVTCYLISIDLVCLFQCTPVHSFWDVGVPGHCINIDNFFIGSGSMNVVLDFIIFAMPIPLLWRLRTSFNQKLVLTLIFTVAGFVVIVSIVRLIVLSRIGKTDLTWNYINSGIWTEIEPAVAVICACLPSLRPLFSVLSRGWQRIPDLRTKLSNNTSSSSRLNISKKRIGGRHSGAQGILRGSGREESSGMFSRLEEMEGGGGAMGLEVRVLGGGKEGDGSEEMPPERGIHVKTEVVLVSTERVDYLDRLF